MYITAMFKEELMESMSMDNILDAASIQVNEHKAIREQKLKEKKRVAARNWKAKKRAQEAERSKVAKSVMTWIGHLKGTGVEVPDYVYAFVDDIANPVVHNTHTGVFFAKVFGASPRVGDSITVGEYLQKTFEAKAKLDMYVKKWAKNGVVVDVVNKSNLIETVYTIKKL